MTDKDNYEIGFTQGMCDFIKRLGTYRPGTIEGVLLFTEEEKKTPYFRGWQVGYQQAKDAADKRLFPIWKKMDDIYSALLKKSVDDEVVTVEQLNEIFSK